MTLEEIKAIAQQRGIKVSRLKKGRSARDIRSDEGNREYFEADSSAACGQDDYRWREICQ